MNARIVAYIVNIDSLARDGLVLRVVSLVKQLRVELLLLLTVSIDAGGSSIDRLGHARFSLPVSSRPHNVAFGVAVVSRLLTIKVATTKHCRLKVLVLLVASVHLTITVAVLHWRITTVGHLRVTVLPITIRRHEGTITLGLVVPICRCRVSVDFLGPSVSGISNRALRSCDLRGSFNHTVVVALLIRSCCITKEHGRTL